MKESAMFVWSCLLLIGVSVLSVVVFTLVHFSLLPWQLKKEREAFSNSFEYTQSKKQLLIALTDEYYQSEVEVGRYRAKDPVKYQSVIDGELRHQELILSRIKSEAKTIPTEEIPPSVKPLINKIN